MFEDRRDLPAACVSISGSFSVFSLPDPQKVHSCPYFRPHLLPTRSIKTEGPCRDRWKHVCQLSRVLLKVNLVRTNLDNPRISCDASEERGRNSAKAARGEGQAKERRPVWERSNDGM